MANDTIDPEAVRYSPPPPNTPRYRWWATPPAGWAAISEDVYDRWQSERPTGSLEPDMATSLGAMAFGYGAYSVYGSNRGWNEVEEELKADWEASGRELGAGDQPWDVVREPVLVGWTAAMPKAVPGAVAPQTPSAQVGAQHGVAQQSLPGTGTDPRSVRDKPPKAPPPPPPRPVPSASFDPDVVDHQFERFVPGGRPDKSGK